MKILRAGLHSLVLVIADLAGVGGGAIAGFQLSGVPNQVWLQLPITVALSIILFSAWMLALGAMGFRRLQCVEAKEAGICLALSVVWAPAIFVLADKSLSGSRTRRDAEAGEFYARCGFTEVGRVTYRKVALTYFELLLAKIK